MQEMKLVTELREVAAKGLETSRQVWMHPVAAALRGNRRSWDTGAPWAVCAMLDHIEANYVEVETDYHPTWVGGGPAWYGNYPGQIGTAQTIVVPKLPAKKTKDELLAEAATLLKQHGVEGRKLAEEIEGA